MKAKLISLLAVSSALLFCKSGNLLAQNDETYKAIYQTRGSYVLDTTANSAPVFETVLEISADKSFFLDRWFELGDSAYQNTYSRSKNVIDAINARVDAAGKGELLMGVKTDFSTNSRETFHAINAIFAFDLYSYKEKLTRPSWEIVQDSTAVKNSYNCIMAKTNYLGREWIVWYTRDIPTPTGPWKLWGLPGLIVEAKDSENLFSFRLTSFSAVSRDELYGDFSKYKDVWAQRRVVKRKQVLESLSFYVSDQLGYLRSIYPGAKVTAHNADGEVSGESFRCDFVYLEK
ncbi:MAG: GLPGLI family protein [Porphyromonas sp.]|nr:GLPGLI family protein [Porphyromonas sp.]